MIFLYLIQFSQTDIIKTIQFNISIVFVYTQLNIKTFLFQIIQFSVSSFNVKNSSISNNLV